MEILLLNQYRLLVAGTMLYRTETRIQIRMNPHWFGDLVIWLSWIRIGSVLGIFIRIQGQGNWPKLTKKKLIHKGFCTFVDVFYDLLATGTGT